MKEALFNPTSGTLKRDRIERVYVSKGPPNPNSCNLRALDLSPSRPEAPSRETFEPEYRGRKNQEWHIVVAP